MEEVGYCVYINGEKVYIPMGTKVLNEDTFPKFMGNDPSNEMHKLHIPPSVRIIDPAIFCGKSYLKIV